MYSLLKLKIGYNHLFDLGNRILFCDELDLESLIYEISPKI